MEVVPYFAVALETIVTVDFSGVVTVLTGPTLAEEDRGINTIFLNIISEVLFFTMIVGLLKRI
jgi:hypothetical protein